MIRKSKFVTLLILVSFLSACATPYKGPGPNFSAKGKDAELEVSKFTLGENYWNQNPNAYHMGPKQELYTEESLKPIIEQVSPEGGEKLRTASTLHDLSLIGLGVGIAGLFAAASTPETGQKLGWLTASIVGSLSSIVLSLSSTGVHADAAKKYNEDLKQRFTPVVGWRWATP